ncbi:hypothetical protein O3M35_007118 [Rhynocoris fuscipes]|uniref:Uncharacterized protein n=1 Tax=Rhynocoris fuscipes TaxID=488301 RepID=A0AAW1DFM3_9HEMI
MYAVHCLRKNWNSGVWIQTKWNHAVGLPTPFIETHRQHLPYWISWILTRKGRRKSKWLECLAMKKIIWPEGSQLGRGSNQKSGHYLMNLIHRLGLR